MKKSILLLSAIFFCSNVFVQGQETFKYLTHTPGSLSVTVWNNGLIGDNAETGASGFISWNGINGIWGSCLVFGTRARATANGGSYSGAGFWDMVNVSSNFAAGFTEETVGNVTFDQVSIAIISDDNATNPYGFDVIQKTYSLTGENVVFCRNGYVNSTEADVTDLYAGFGGDWEIGQTQANSGGIDTDYNLVYVYEPGSNKPYFGFATFDSLSGCKVWPNTFLNETQARNDAFTYISTIDQVYPGVGNQKSSVGSYIGDVAVGDTAWVTFAIVAGNDLGGIKANTARAFEIAKNAGWTDKLASVYTGDQIINVPNDYSTIQEAINSSADGDTVLVADGTYFENINFKGKAITVASQFLFDGDETHIDNTIINGSKPTQPDKGTVVQFDSGEDTTSVLYGFTITGGKGSLDPYGYGTMGAGGIGVNNAGAKIKCNKITGNIITHNSDAEGGGIIINANSKDVLILENFITNNKLITSAANSEGGGGIFLYNCNSHNITIAKNIIADNIVSTTSGALAGYGGAIYLNSSKALIRNNLIKDNGATYGGGISVDEYPSSVSPDFINNTIINNEAQYNGGGLYINSAGAIPKMINSILWGNTAPSNPQHNNLLLTEYSDIESGFQSKTNIDLDPLFEDKVDCCLSSSSPCIDAGDPNEIYNDLDGSRNDMGCYGGHSPINIILDVKEITPVAGIPNTYTLSQNYPNPFNPTTKIQYSILEKSLVTIKVYNILGKEVKTLVNENQNVGKYEINFDANDLSSGVYFYTLTAGNFIETKKMILLR